LKKVDKKLFHYAIIMILAVLAIILYAYFSELRFNDMENDYEAHIKTQEQETSAFQEKIKGLEEKNVTLEKEVKTLKKEIEKSSGTASDNETYQQALKILSDIYILIENKEFDKAKTELEKFDTSTFDDTVVNYKKALEALLK